MGIFDQDGEAAREAKDAFYRYAKEANAQFDKRHEAFKVAAFSAGSRLTQLFWETAETVLRRIMAGDAVVWVETDERGVTRGWTDEGYVVRVFEVLSGYWMVEVIGRDGRVAVDYAEGGLSGAKATAVAVVGAMRLVG